ncbi:hypothetical protein DPX16_18603 [Anabarilius grahami]|uniref:Uncharacterized protein n=1 Tax=Anabarilius grahami TaxID=495550 RepID=A0A3N0YP91_ANAGA|nr:hypothetical protein DPX16_18603 [Anabarilius grahami]
MCDKSPGLGTSTCKYSQRHLTVYFRLPLPFHQQLLLKDSTTVRQYVPTNELWDTACCDPAVAQICCSISPERRHRDPQEHSKLYKSMLNKLALAWGASDDSHPIANVCH